MSRVTNSSDLVTVSANDVAPDENDELLRAVEAIEMGMGADVGLVDDECPWTRELVMERLEEAIKLVHRTAGRVGPRGYGSSMPAYLYSELDLWYQETQTQEERERGDFERNRAMRPATVDQIREADEALLWPGEFIQAGHVRKALLLWMMCRAIRMPFSRALKLRGIAQRTGISRRDRAIVLIVHGLSMRDVRLREDAMTKADDLRRHLGAALANSEFAPFKLASATAMANAGMEMAMCHDNAERWSRLFPGCEPVPGWLLTAEGHGGAGGVFVRHSMVRSRTGALLDVTPRHPGDDRLRSFVLHLWDEIPFRFMEAQVLI